jgi:hypothetical protein
VSGRNLELVALNEVVLLAVHADRICDHSNDEIIVPPSPML